MGRAGLSQRQRWAGSEWPEHSTKSTEIRDSLCLKRGFRRGLDTLKARREHTRPEEVPTPAGGSSSKWGAEDPECQRPPTPETPLSLVALSALPTLSPLLTLGHSQVC